MLGAALTPAPARRLLARTTLPADAGSCSVTFAAVSGREVEIVAAGKYSAACTPQLTFKSGGSGGTIQQVIEGTAAAANFLRLGSIATHAADCWSKHRAQWTNNTEGTRPAEVPVVGFATTAAAGVASSMRMQHDGASYVGAIGILGGALINYAALAPSAGNLRAGFTLEAWELLT